MATESQITKNDMQAQNSDKELIINCHIGLSTKGVHRVHLMNDSMPKVCQHRTVQTMPRPDSFFPSPGPNIGLSVSLLKYILL